MKNDLQLKSDVDEELAWDPEVNASHIGVIVQGGVVTLTGHVDSLSEKHAAERAVLRLSGVRGLALELDVKLGPCALRSDTEIAQAACAALDLNSVVPPGKVKLEVEHGQVTLTGEVEWDYQRRSAEQAVRPVIGVRAIHNRISVRPNASSQDIGAQIAAAFSRQAAREARHIDIDVADGVVTLRGKVHSVAEHRAAIGTARAARGVVRVVDGMEITG